MARAMDPQQQMVTRQEMVLAQMFESEALLTVREREGLVSRAEVLDEAKPLRKPDAR